jgi:hypothetical protein
VKLCLTKSQNYNRIYSGIGITNLPIYEVI